MKRFAFVAAVCLLATGCGNQDAPPAPPVSPQARSPQKPPDAGSDKPRPAESPKTAQPKVDVAGLLKSARDRVDQGDLDRAIETLSEVEKLGETLSKDESAAVKLLRGDVDTKLAEQASQRRAAQVKQATELVAAGKLEDATQAIDEVLKNFPSDDERAKVESLRKQIEEHRRRKRELGVAMQLLASDKPSDIRGARTRLTADPDVALPLVAEAVSSSDAKLAGNAIDLLRSFNDPDQTLPILVGVLGKPEQSVHWPAVIRELQKSSSPGAGPLLLGLVQKTTDANQRSAILSALAVVADPPPDTLTALLPAVFQETADLPVALKALRHAITVNGQSDLLTLRSIPGEATPELETRLADLAGRLETLAKVEKPTETSQAALALGITTRLLAPQALPDVKLLSASAEAPDSTAAACLDGAWTQIDVKSMWRHPSDKPVTLKLDLGTERTVAGIKIWNHNEAGGRHRGWKEVDVFVSDSTRATLTPVAKGVIPMAPGVADPPDYGSVIPVPCVRGRYIRLEARTYWQPDGVAGISEIQVLGF